MRNKHPGYCCICKKYVKNGDGHCERINYKKIYDPTSKKHWFVRCLNCVGKGAPWKQEKKAGDKL